MAFPADSLVPRRTFDIGCRTTGADDIHERLRDGRFRVVLCSFSFSFFEG